MSLWQNCMEPAVDFHLLLNLYLDEAHQAFLQTAEASTACTVWCVVFDCLYQEN